MSGTPAACTVLAGELQRLRTANRLSLGALAERTPFSKSSWGRYLNGKALPPWQAVQQLCALVDEPEDRFRALWTVAEAAWNRRDAVSAPAPVVHQPEPEPEPAVPAEPRRLPERPAPEAPAAQDPSPHGRVRRRTFLAVFGAGALLATLVGLLWNGVTPQGASPAAVTSASPSARPVGCVGQACDGADPGAMDCGVYPQSLGVFQLQHGTQMEVRYSAQCRAAWARVWSSQKGDRLSIAAGADQRSAVVPDPYTAQTFFYTPMVPATARGAALHACLAFTDGASRCVTVHEP
ncbi:XRE family transcriptional regulator [Streptacidiphilus pinicola]|uniref:XRE family transcriptional regulator n=1 Tax=Streptacidiphilus pinicola TaxID=2219663 RepID=A0A2X0K2J7_9ACTN|nr:DUF2690 domain-containing protein [Streptacidiphilus pinicola]RAG81789.1 XRE family transcriptional regulator [Streptacidiphilus pinicola]